MRKIELYEVTETPDIEAAERIAREVRDDLRKIRQMRIDERQQETLDELLKCMSPEAQVKFTQGYYLGISHAKELSDE